MTRKSINNVLKALNWMLVNGGMRSTVCFIFNEQPLIFIANNHYKKKNQSKSQMVCQKGQPHKSDIILGNR